VERQFIEEGSSMAKDAVTEAVTEAVGAPVVQVTLEEFCVRLSNTDRRVELLSAFHFTEKQAARLKDAESNYAARYTAFINKPV
jgi:hypothetical protein